jgi:hypothetical protein
MNTLRKNMKELRRKRGNLQIGMGLVGVIGFSACVIQTVEKPASLIGLSWLAILLCLIAFTILTIMQGQTYQDIRSIRKAQLKAVVDRQALPPLPFRTAPEGWPDLAKELLSYLVERYDELAKIVKEDKETMRLFIEWGTLTSKNVKRECDDTFLPRKKEAKSIAAIIAALPER